MEIPDDLIEQANKVKDDDFQRLEKCELHGIGLVSRAEVRTLFVLAHQEIDEAISLAYRRGAEDMGLEIADKLYFLLPAGEMDAFELIKDIEKLRRELMKPASSKVEN